MHLFMFYCSLKKVIRLLVYRIGKLVYYIHVCVFNLTSWYNTKIFCIIIINVLQLITWQCVMRICIGIVQLLIIQRCLFKKKKN